MDQQRHSNALHRLERRHAAAKQVRHPCVRIRRRPCGIQLNCERSSRLLGPQNFTWSRVVRQIKRHQGREIFFSHTSLRHRLLDAGAIGLGQNHRSDRRLEVRHHDRARKLPGCRADYRREDGAIP